MICVSLDPAHEHYLGLISPKCIIPRPEISSYVIIRDHAQISMFRKKETLGIYLKTPVPNKYKHIYNILIISGLYGKDSSDWIVRNNPEEGPYQREVLVH